MTAIDASANQEDNLPTQVIAAFSVPSTSAPFGCSAIDDNRYLIAGVSQDHS
jgi:hypothetical protein